ncbi:SprT-like domain-containing protein [Haladaptatus litoreus]|uniref:SprT-like domain-containing protein n=1 Tax=Haladaptatus litoreus TaxID=553468 RepID=UPI001FE80CA7|nr:SprT-like domain-containing protein [Haladaptatus litoreus]
MWKAYEQLGWEQFSSTVRHELIHAWQYHEFGDADHGATFTRWTDDLETSKHCERFTRSKCGGSSARIAAVDFPGINARRRYVPPNSTAVASAVGHYTSRRPTTTDRFSFT